MEGKKDGIKSGVTMGGKATPLTNLHKKPDVNKNTGGGPKSGKSIRLNSSGRACGYCSKCFVYSGSQELIGTRLGRLKFCSLHCYSDFVRQFSGGIREAREFLEDFFAKKDAKMKDMPTLS